FYNGDRRIEAPWVLGHEISGEVVEIGPRAEEEVAASGISVGDEVHCISTLWCGRCRMCRGGAENLCLNGELMGFDHPGAYADGVAAVSRETDGFGADVVIVACSSDVAQQEAMEMAAPRGRVLFFGGLPKGTTHIQFPSNVLHYKEVQVHGSYASRHRDQVAA